MQAAVRQHRVAAESHLLEQLALVDPGVVGEPGRAFRYVARLKALQSACPFRHTVVRSCLPAVHCQQPSIVYAVMSWQHAYTGVTCDTALPFDSS